MQNPPRLALAAFALFASTAIAQPPTGTQPSPPSPAPKRSTLAGVYTAEQASRGSDTYAMMCRSCHTPASHSGATFATWWKGKTLADLFVFMSERMPKNDPGSLEPSQYADLVAYLLKMNALPVGPSEVPSDTLALASIRIDVRKPAVTPKRKPVASPKKTPARRPGS